MMTFIDEDYLFKLLERNNFKHPLVISKEDMKEIFDDKVFDYIDEQKYTRCKLCKYVDGEKKCTNDGVTRAYKAGTHPTEELVCPFINDWFTGSCVCRGYDIIGDIV